MPPRSQRRLLIAHRGASAAAPEGTRAAIREAVRTGAGMIELDVQMTRDGRLVVFHDDRLARTTNGTGWLTRARYPDLAQLDAGSWFHPRFRGERILLVSQALRLIPPPVRINLELKQTAHPRALLARLRRMIQRARVRPRLLLSSFDPALMRALRASRLARALICRRKPQQSLRQSVRLGCSAWHPFRALVTPSRVAQAHAAGLRVHAWTVDNPRQARRLFRMGVDGLFTNDPARLSQALRRPRS